MDLMDPGAEGLTTCGDLWQRAVAPKGRWWTPILQAWRLGGSDPGGLEACRLGALDWTARAEGARCEVLVGWKGALVRSTLREVGGYITTVWGTSVQEIRIVLIPLDTIWDSWELAAVPL